MKTRVLLIVCLLAPFARSDARDDAYQRFYKNEIAGKWAAESLSEQRAVMLRGFDKHDCPAAAEWLLEHGLTDNAGLVAREAVRILGTYKRPPTVAAIAEYWTKKTKRNAEQRALAVVALAKMKHEAIDDVLAEALDDKDARVVACACRAVGEGLRIKHRPALEKLLGHKHWAARAAAASALGALGGEESLPVLFHAFCKEESHRVRYDAWRALRKLTLEKRGSHPEEWRDFWEKRAGEVEVAEGEKNPWGSKFPRVARDAGKAAPYFNIPLLADRIVFVFDVNGRMANSWDVDIKAERAKPREERIPNFFSVKTRWDLVRAWTNQCLGQMPDSTEIAFVFFNDDVATYPEKPRLLKNKSRTQKKITEHLTEGVKLGATSAMYEGLSRAWGFLKDGHPERNFDQGAETIVFVTNSKPSDGAFRNREDALRDEVWRVAVTRNLHVHTIGLHNHAFALLQDIAKSSGALYVHVQMEGDTAEPQDLEFWPEKKKAFEAARKKKSSG